MSDLIASTLDEFGRGIGIPGLAIGDDLSLTLQLGAERRLVFRLLGDSVLLLMSCPISVGAGLAVKCRALDLCRLDHGAQVVVQAGLSRGGDLLFMTRLPARQFRPDLLDRCCEMLRRLHEQAQL